MQSTASPPVAVSPHSLAAAFADVPDPRRAASVRYPLAAILSLAVTALLANHHSVLAMAEWGARQRPEQLQALGFREGRSPCQSTLHRLFRTLDGPSLAQTLTRSFAAVAGPAVTTDRGAAESPVALQGVAIDGKAQRGRLRFAADGPVHALSAFCHDTGIVLAQEAITSTAEKGEAELTVAPALLDRLDWQGRVLTGDALFCQRELCQQVVKAGGDYVLVVKDNQPTLHADLQLLFDPPPHPAPLPLTDRRTARTIDTGHGRRPDVRELTASTDLTGYLDWPGVAQVVRIERTWRDRGQPKRAVHYAITSLPPDRGTPERLLGLKRGHWLIENRLHWRKDMTFGEDASLIHAGQGPAVMSHLRNAASNLLHHHGVQQVAARLRAHSQHPEEAITMVIGPLIPHA